MGSTQFDDSRWPIVQVTTPDYILDEAAFLHYLDQLSSYHERRELFGFLFDVRSSPPMPARQRRLIAERIDSDVVRFGRRCPCALVVANPLQSGVVKVVMWLLHEPHPVSVFSSIPAAEDWLRGHWSSRSWQPPSSERP